MNGCQWPGCNHQEQRKGYCIYHYHLLVGGGFMDDQEHEQRQDDLKVKEVDDVSNKCDWCGKDYEEPGGCSSLPVKHDGVDYLPIAYGNETLWNELSLKAEGPCHDCGVMPGEFHHCGCDVEECPICGKQFLTCDHSTIEDDAGEDEA